MFDWAKSRFKSLNYAITTIEKKIKQNGGKVKMSAY